MRFVGFIGPSYTLQSVNVDCQRCINLYPEINEIGSGKEREVASLVATPGLRLLVTLGVGPIRGMWTASNGRVFVVSSNKLYELSSSWVATERGTLNSFLGQVSIADNGIHLVIVDGVDGYVLTFADNVFTEITDPEWPGANQVVFQDTYFIFSQPNSGIFFLSAMNDVTFDWADVKVSEGNPDNLIAIISDHQALWLLNANTIEVYYNSGAADFPFEKIQGAFIEHGIAARFSVQKMNNSVFWLGQDDKGSGQIFMAKGYQPQRISTHAVEQAISGYLNISDANAYSYQENGHCFYVINFPTANTTWAYDTTTNLWHERIYVNQGQFERHRSNCHAYAFSTHIVGDYANGKVYELSSRIYSDDGSEILRRRVAPHMTDGLKRVFYQSFQLDIETGTGLDGVGQGTDPQAMLQFSDDGGHTWSSERWAGIGKIGQTKRQAKWSRLGSSVDRVWRVTISDPVKVTMIGAEIKLKPGTS